MLKYDFNGFCVFLESYSGYQNQLVNFFNDECTIATKWGINPALKVAQNAIDEKTSSSDVEPSYDLLKKEIQQINLYVIKELNGNKRSKNEINQIVSEANKRLDSFFKRENLK
jgi:undecaprenyl pyrophosphate synthase